MNIFFEESGSFKTGAILSRQGEALQVELPGGRRAKVKAKEILIEFDAPSLTDWMHAANECAQQIDLDFLWECASDEEFHFLKLADEYFGASAAPSERAALALKLHGAPAYFRRKGRGFYQRAPAEQLKAALAAFERRRQQAEIQAGYETELKNLRLPDAFNNKALALLTHPDKSSLEYKALDAASATLGKSHAQLMIDCGGITSPRALHEGRFLAEHFPRGADFPESAKLNLTAAQLNKLPAAEVQAFSIDDVTTTEIDDAFSVQHLADGRIRIGIHIAAPALGIKPEDAIDAIARERLSTVYMPGEKITMLPEAVVDVFTLKEGGHRPALSLYVIIDSASQQVVTSETRLESVFIAHNLRYHQLDDVVTEEALATGSGDYPYKDEIAVLWPLAQALNEKRQQARIGYGLKRETQQHAEFSFYIDNEHVTILPRPRHSPIGLIVAELAILANSTWGELLAEHGVPGIYRIQRSFGANRTRMQLTPAPHEGLGVAQYAWSTSPLRRYVDLVNQWQLISCAEDGVAAKLTAPFKPKDAMLYAITQSFTDTYAAYNEHQRRMERFWCLRWLQQEKRERVVASVIKGDLVRFDEIPLTLNVPGLGIQPNGAKLLLDILHTDELILDTSCRLVQVLSTAETPPAEQTPPSDAVENTVHSEAEADTNA